eukprot:NODE_1949_length_2328_cov_4.268514.p1 GENE.NODE_1949_length_2328_cov_4.268514~~NODE_1949_length_2328_cov_4.268514.p1  ORF type:complete len:535 (-),score=113.23 NODE_1949_length_2328_cov_4.268514:265-1869(-)
MVAGGTFGATCGATVGYFMDTRLKQKKLHDSQLEMQRLKCLVRWAGQHLGSNFHDNEEAMKLLEMVVLEFKPIAEIAANSENARKLLKVLDNWIATKTLTRLLGLYMENLLQKWRELSRAEFLQCLRVFQILSTTYRFARRQLAEEEVQFAKRMERMLLHDSVMLVMTHAHPCQTANETRVMECLVFADAIRKSRRRGSSTPPGDQDDGIMVVRRVSGMPPASSSGSRSPAHSDSDMSDEGVGVGESSSIASIGSLDHEREQEVSPAAQKVLTKPFFKNWEDFMDFNLTFKHKLPITHCEFDLLLEKEAESLNSWEVCLDRKDMRVAKKLQSSGIVSLRAWATVHGVHPLVAYHLFADPERRLRWDKIFSIIEIVEDNVQGNDIIYTLMKMGGVQPRDFLQYRRVRVQDDGTIIIIFRSAVHPSKPEDKRYIRAESFISGYILKMAPGADSSNPSLQLFILSCVDIKGLVPKFIINALAPRKPAEWVETLTKAAMEFQDADPNYSESLLGILSPRMQENPYDYEGGSVHVVDSP